MCSSRRKNKINPFPESVKCVAITTLASSPDKVKISKTVKALNKLGIKTLLAPGLFEKNVINGLPVSIESRIDDLQSLWLDRSVDLILSARGGYGSAQLLDTINWKKLSKRNMPVLGYSDITAFHLAMLKHGAGIPLTSPMGEEFFDFCKYDTSLEFFSLALNTALRISQKNCKADSFLNKIPLDCRKKLKVIKSGKAIGKIIPANLTVFTSMIGSSHMPDLKNSIMVFEDIDEPLYVLDRMLTQIQQAGFFAKFAGLAFADFRKCGNAGGRNAIFAKFANYVNGPVISGVPFGHIPANLSFAMGEKVVLDV